MVSTYNPIFLASKVKSYNTFLRKELDYLTNQLIKHVMNVIINSNVVIQQL